MSTECWGNTMNKTVSAPKSFDLVIRSIYKNQLLISGQINLGHHSLTIIEFGFYLLKEIPVAWFYPFTYVRS